MREKTEMTLGGAIATISFILVFLAAWLTHVVWSIKLLITYQGPSLGPVVLAALGILVPPVGTVHGLYIWFF